jgi:hypothetical protein
MKLSCTLLLVLLAIACTSKKTKTMQVLLQPASVITKHYTTEQTIQNFITTRGKDETTYVKYMNEYAVTYTPEDTTVSLDIIFKNFRVEYEDGGGIQVFDTKFDKPDFTTPDTRFFFVMKNKKVSAIVSNNGALLQVKGITPLKSQILTDYQSLGFDKKAILPGLDSFLYAFIKTQVLEENLLFYTRKPVMKDSSYFVSGVTKMPAYFSLAINYTMKPVNETKTFLSGKGSATLQDKTIMNNIVTNLSSKPKEATLFDEVQLDQKTGILTYRKMFIEYSDSIQFKNQSYPIRLILEKQLQEKKISE